jgi:hypothetical protein
MDVLRVHKRRNIPIEIAEREYIEEMPDALTAEENGYLEKVKIHFNQMGEPCKGLLQRFYFQKHTIKQIASHFSWTDATAKNNKYRCIQKLRDAVLNNKSHQ